MGVYVSEWYGFEVESKRHLMDLLIEPSFSPAICSQFHEMADGSYKVYYNFQPRWKEVTDALKAYARQQNMDPSTKAVIALDIAASAGVFKALAPISSFSLDDKERSSVDELYANELPATDEHHQGLDGHSFKLKIYKDNKERFYESWCVTPLNWGSLRNLVSIVVDRLGLSYESYGAYIRKASS